MAITDYIVYERLYRVLFFFLLIIVVYSYFQNRKEYNDLITNGENVTDYKTGFEKLYRTVEAETSLVRWKYFLPLSLLMGIILTYLYGNIIVSFDSDWKKIGCFVVALMLFFFLNDYVYIACANRILVTKADEIKKEIVNHMEI